MTTFFNDFLKITYAALAYVFSTMEADILTIFNNIQNQITYLSITWAGYFTGVFGPAYLILVIGISGTAGYAVFIYAGVGNEVVKAI